jgi:mannonate dehydratase
MVMRAALGQFDVPTDEDLQLAADLGVSDVLVNTPHLPGSQRWEMGDLVKLRLRLEWYGLRLAALENVPTFFYDHIMLNGPRRDQQIDSMIYTIRSMAGAGIPIFGYNWMPSSPLTDSRGYTVEELWGNLQYWVEIITPIAEEEGIRLGIRPCDPLVSMSGGTPLVLRSFAACKRLVEIYPSPCNAIEFCDGTMAEIEDEVDIYDKIRYFGSRDKILYAHIRTVSSPKPRLQEEFANTGYVDMYKAMEIYYDVGFDGFFLDDHASRTSQNTPSGQGGRAFAIGYIQAMIDAVTRQRAAAGLQRGSIRNWTPDPLVESPSLVTA